MSLLHVTGRGASPLRVVTTVKGNCDGFEAIVRGDLCRIWGFSIIGGWGSKSLVVVVFWGVVTVSGTLVLIVPVGVVFGPLMWVECLDCF